MEKRDAHYLRDVLRMRKGERIIVFDGEEGEGYIEDIFRTHVNIIIKNWRRIQRGIGGLSIVLGQSILKGEKMDMVVEKATEIGVTSIIPLITERVIPKAGCEKRRRWEKVALEATRLSGRLTPPEISQPISLNDFSKESFKGLKILPWEEEKEVFFLPLLMEEKNFREAAVIMGPEGGFSEGEVNLLRGAGFKTVSLGSLILRSDTATIFTLSCLASFYRMSKGGREEI